MARKLFVQNNWRSYSQWIRLHKTHTLSCCDCGLVHQINLKIMRESDGSYVVYQRLRRHLKQTKTLRKKQVFSFTKERRS